MMFNEMADEIFSQAGADKQTHTNLYEQTVNILSSKMAELSVLYGLSHERVRLFDEQKQSLVNALKEICNERPTQSSQ